MWVSRLGLFVLVCSCDVSGEPPSPGQYNAGCSSDGITWTATDLVYSTRFGDIGPGGGSINQEWVGIADDGETLFVLVQSIGVFDTVYDIFSSIFTSTDGMTWTELATQPPDSFQADGIAYGDGVLMLVGRISNPPNQYNPNPYGYKSDDGGATWTEMTFPSDFQFPYDLKYMDGVWVALGETPTPPPSGAQGWNVGTIALQ